MALVALASFIASVAVPAQGSNVHSQPEATDLPVLSREVPRGTYAVVEHEPAGPGARKRLDGEISDWVGETSGFGGTGYYSEGEFVYQDHLFDAYGADDGADARRVALLRPLNDAVPETYRLEALAQADLPGQIGLPAPDELGASTQYGDLEQDYQTDLVEVRVDADGGSVWLLARTTTLESSEHTALLLLADLDRDGRRRKVAFQAGIRSRAEVAILLAGDRGWLARPGREPRPLPAGTVVTNPSGYTNALEARLPRRWLADGERLRLAAATGVWHKDEPRLERLGLGANLTNVAFRRGEPVREWFDKRQALALYEGSIDGFMQTIDLGAVERGADQTLVPRPGYHDRIFVSSPQISEEKEQEGIYQHYGVYIPTSYRPAKSAPLQFWLHWRGGKAHSAAALAPRIFKHFGEDVRTIVVSPRGRGTSRWYVGKGHVDFLEVWRDVMRTFSVDRRRVYVAGHSMGGFGSYLLSILYPDRFAGAMPVAAPVTQGAWTGIDFPGCDEFKYDEYTPCYISANDGKPRVQHTRRLLENVGHVPYAMFYAVGDELVPYGGGARQAERLVGLGYRHRLYSFPAHEHYSHPVVDQWAEGVDYLHSFVRDAMPARVTFIRDMPFERATESVQADGLDLDFDFDSAYWLKQLVPRDPKRGIARFDGISRALSETPHLAVPETGSPASAGQTGPYVMTGVRWIDQPTAAPERAANGFGAYVSGARAVGLDLDRMKVDPSRPIEATLLSAGAPLELRLMGRWESTPRVKVNGRVAPAWVEGSTLYIDLPRGRSRLVIAGKK